MIQERAIAVNAIEKETQVTLRLDEVVKIPADNLATKTYAATRDDKTVLCRINPDGTTTVITIEW